MNGEIRAAVMSILNRGFENCDPPQVPEETKLINELIREYLTWNGYLYTEQILSAGNIVILTVRQNQLTRLEFCAIDNLAV